MIVTPMGRARTVPMSAAQVQALIDLEPLLKDLQLHLVCPRCLAHGRTQDALVGGNNAPEDRTWNVSCACTVRTFERGASH